MKVYKMGLYAIIVFVLTLLMVMNVTRSYQMLDVTLLIGGILLSLWFSVLPSYASGQKRMPVLRVFPIRIMAGVSLKLSNVQLYFITFIIFGLCFYGLLGASVGEGYDAVKQHAPDLLSTVVSGDGCDTVVFVLTAIGVYLLVLSQSQKNHGFCSDDEWACMRDDDSHTHF
jgi:hypothetical protein